MNNSYKLISIEVFIFFITFFIALILYTFYNIIKPETYVIPYNFSPYPNISPKQLSDAQMSFDSCDKNLVPCTNGKCSKCSDEYECVEVTNDDNIYFNERKVPEGKWCLPKKPNLECNRYTGRWIWGTSDKCVNVPGKIGNQCWICECLYPDIYGGDNCMTQNSCLNTTTKLGIENLDNQNSTLVATKALTDDYPHLNIIAGKTKWDPTSINNDAMNFGPYDKNKDEKPYFECNCNGNDKLKLVNLPNDPYSCHLDHCLQQRHDLGKNDDNFIDPGVGVKIDNDILSCGCGTNDYIKATQGYYDGLCVNKTNSLVNKDGIVIDVGCGITPGTYYQSDNTCHCPQTVGSFYIPHECKSDHANQDKNIPVCNEPQNPLGSECIDPCKDIQCSLVGTENLKISPDVNPPTCNCNCKQNVPLQGLNNATAAGYYSGTNCSNLYLNSDTKINEQDPWMGVDITYWPEHMCEKGSYGTGGNAHYCR